MIEDAAAVSIIDHETVKGLPNTYTIGCFAKRVTFYSQQNRALNLIWALFHKKKIDSSSTIAIIGGGLAGLSAAVAAKSKGCTVTIFEAEDEFMPIQRGNNTRYIHPYIYDWPAYGCNTNETDLPFLNWEADVAENVIKQIDKEWQLHSAGITIKKSTKINSIFHNDGKPFVHCNQGSQQWPFDCVILAVGFGEEKPLENVAMSLYWTSDGLHQKPIGAPKKSYLVSGCGDGGLIDTLRLTIKNFDHKLFTEKFLEGDFVNIHKSLLEIDENAMKYDDKKASVYLSTEYGKITPPADLENFIKNNIRTNTIVTLNGRTPNFMTVHSSLLNRFAVYLIMKTQKLSYISGDISVTKPEPQYTVTFKSEINSQSHKFDEIVVRHGPKAVVGSLIGQGHPHFDSDKTDPSAKKVWTNEFYIVSTTTTSTTTTTTTVPPLSRMDLAYKYYEELKLKFVAHRDVTGCLLGGTSTVPEYRVELRTKSLPKAFKGIKDFKGIPVKYTFNQTFKFSMTSSEIKLSSSKAIDTDVLRSGASIRNKSLNVGPMGTLGCFVITSDGFPAILSTSHVLAPKGENSGKIVAQNFSGKKEKWIADQFHNIRLFSKKEALNDSSEANLVDAAIATLRPGIKFSNKLPLNNGEWISIAGVGEPDPGDRVYKYSVENGLTSGKVVAVHGTVFVEYAKTKRQFNEVIMVEGNDNIPFSTKGDSGCLVYNNEGMAIGLVFAMSEKISILCPLSSVLKELNCKLFV